MRVPRTGARPAVKRGPEVTAKDFQAMHVLALGDRASNVALVNASP